MAMFTTAIQNDILKLVIGMFKASVGGKYLQDFRAFVEAVPTAVPVGGTKPLDPVVELAKTLQTKAEFLSVFPASQSNAQFQDAFLNYFSLQNNTEARAFVSQKIAAGLGRGEVILEAVRALDTYTGPDVQIKSAQTFFAGKFNLAFAHSVNNNVQELALTPLQAVLIGTDLPPVPIPSVAPSAAPAPAPAAPSPITSIQTIVEGVLTAGPVLAGNQLEVSAFGNQGQLLGTAPVGAGGTYSLAIPLSYTGPILVRVFDKGTSPDYLDEATGQPRDLDADIRAVSNIPFAGGTFQVNLNPLTELAVRTVGLQSGDSGASQTNLNSITAAQIAQANQTVANAFGLTGVNLTGGAPNSTPNLIVNADGTPNPNANTYGRVLASLSGAEAGQGQTTGRVLDQFLNSLNQNNGTLGTEARQTLIVGSINVDPTGNRGVSTDVGRTQGNSQETQNTAQATYVKLGQLADKVNPAPTVTLQELQALGVTGLDAPRLKDFLTLVGMAPNAAAVDSYLEIQAIANKAQVPTAAQIGTPPNATVTEDINVIVANGNSTITATGKLPITDVNAGEAVFTTTVTAVVTAPATSLGTLTLAANGDYTYTVNNSSAAVQALGQGRTATDTFRVTSVDGTSKDISFTINGTNDAPVFTATSGVTVQAGAVGTVAGLVVGSYTEPTDVDSTAVTVDFTGNSNANGYYQLDLVNRQVKLTQAGANFANANNALPEISLTATDNNAATAGNTSGSSIQKATPGFTLDKTVPTVTITDDKANTVTSADANNGVITYTFTFSEVVTGFTAEDITVTNGTKGTLTPTTTGDNAGKVYTLVVTPTASLKGDVTVGVAANKAMDAAGNGNTAATDNVQAVDLAPTNVAPVVTAFTANATAVSVLATDADAGNTLNLTLGRSPASNVIGVVTTQPERSFAITPTAQTSVATTTIQVSDGTATSAAFGTLVEGTDSNDTALGSSTAATPQAIYGFVGKDTLIGGTGNDSLFGGADADTVNYNLSTAGSDQINLGAETVTSDSLNDVVNVSSTGATQIRVTFTSANVGNGTGAGTSADGALTEAAASARNTVTLQAETGTTDTLGGSIGYADDEGTTLIAGNGTTFDVRDAVSGAQRGNAFNLVALGSSGKDTFDYSAAAFASQNLYVNAGGDNDTVTGNAGGDFLVGGSGNDQLNGGAGNDSYIGGTGNDTIVGAGIALDVDVGSDMVVAYNLATDGEDTIDLGTEQGVTNSSIDVVNVSSVPAGGSAATEIRLTLNTGNVGNGAGLNTSGQAESFTLQAEDVSGNPAGSIGRVDDEGVMVVPGGTTLLDVRNTATPGTSLGSFHRAVLGTATGEALDFSGAGFNALNLYIHGGNNNVTIGDTITGNSGNDYLVGGNMAGDTLNGGAGADTLVGGDGADTYNLGSTATPNDNAIDTVVDNGQTVAIAATTGAITGFDLVRGFEKGTDVLNFNGGVGLQLTGTLSADGTSFTLGQGTTNNSVIVFNDANNNFVLDDGEKALVVADVAAAGAAVDLNGAVDGNGYNQPPLPVAVELLNTGIQFTVTGSGPVSVRLNQSGTLLDNTGNRLGTLTNVGNVYTFTPATTNSTGSVLSGVLQVTDGSKTANLINYALGTTGNDTVNAATAAGFTSSLGSLIVGLEGTDNLTGGANNDLLLGGMDDNTLTGGAGNDRLVGGANQAAAFNGDGGDDALVVVFVASPNNPQLGSFIGGDGTDTLEIATSRFIVGRANSSGDQQFDGIQNILLRGANDSGDVTLDLGGGTNLSSSSTNSKDTDNYIITAFAGNTTGKFTISTTNTAIASKGPNGIPNFKITGGANDDILIGHSMREDILDGGAGNDTLRGRGGADTLVGGTGVDTYLLDGNSRENLVENGSALSVSGAVITGFDLVQSFAKGKNLVIFNDGVGKQITGTYASSANTNTFTLSSTGNDVLLFNDANNNNVVDAGELGVVLVGLAAAGAAVDLNGAAEGNGFELIA